MAAIQVICHGKQEQEYPDFRPGEKVRLRVINAAASSYFWITFGGGNPTLISADGLNVEPVEREYTLIGIAETYDFMITIPGDGKLEFRATAQDGSGTTSAFLGDGQGLPALDVPRPDKIAMMKKMAQMNMKMGAPAAKFQPGKDEPHKMMQKWGMQMNGGMQMEHNNEGESGNMDDMNNREMEPEEMDDEGMEQVDMNMEVSEMSSEIGYDYLKSLEKTTYPEDVPVKEILLNLTKNITLALLYL